MVSSSLVVVRRKQKKSFNLSTTIHPLIDSTPLHLFHQSWPTNNIIQSAPPLQQWQQELAKKKHNVKRSRSTTKHCKQYNRRLDLLCSKHYRTGLDGQCALGRIFWVIVSKWWHNSWFGFVVELGKRSNITETNKIEDISWLTHDRQISDFLAGNFS